MLKRLLLENKKRDKLIYLLKKHKETFKLSKEEHEEIVADFLFKIDPTSQKKYVKWMILKAFNPRSIRRIRQDWEKYNEYLTLFYNNRKNPKMLENDIMLIKSWSELKEVVEPFMEPDEHDWKSTIEDLEEGDDYEIIKETPKNKLISILTQRGASYLGGDTEWCTTYGEYCLNPNHKRRTSEFPEAIRYGKVYLLWSKKDDKRWQFQRETGQYMDENDVDDLSGMLHHIQYDPDMMDEMFNIFDTLQEMEKIFINKFENSSKKTSEQDNEDNIFWLDKNENLLAMFNLKSRVFFISFDGFKETYPGTTLSITDFTEMKTIIKYLAYEHLTIENIKYVRFIDFTNSNITRF